MWTDIQCTIVKLTLECYTAIYAALHQQNILTLDGLSVPIAHTKVHLVRKRMVNGRIVRGQTTCIA